MNFRTHPICLSYTDADTVILQQETKTIHVSNFELQLYSQPVGPGLLVELLANGVERLAGILEHVRNFAFDAFDVLHSASLNNFSQVFQCVACDTIHLIQEHNLMRSSGLLCLIFKGFELVCISAPDMSVCATAT